MPAADQEEPEDLVVDVMLTRRTLAQAASRWREKTRHARDERGLTLVEATIASALMLVVIGAFGTLATTLIAAQTNGIAGENASTDMRSVVIQLQSDIQAASPDTASPISSPTGIDTPSSLAAANLELQLQLGPVGSQQTVTWTYDPVAQTLTRSVSSSPTSAPTLSVTELHDVVNSCTSTSCTQPIFSYFGQGGTNLMSNSPTTATISNCTTRVEVGLLHFGGKLALLPAQSIDVQLANVLPGSLTCG